ncbi:hypothetical protein TELCIR_01711 [Teladorsagia circumcincta]|uniref:Uncharacterized protein n=1 Tax=Teladorsagia circumcincta TaxID=45464 RepID=A0A2G9V2N7_TELCI|nr:hypothetical protein TELCIR_01711 [Teladorsagia circumcincta]
MHMKDGIFKKLVEKQAIGFELELNVNCYRRVGSLVLLCRF